MPIHTNISRHKLSFEIDLLKKANKTINHIIPESFIIGGVDHDNKRRGTIETYMILFEDQELKDAKK